MADRPEPLTWLALQDVRALVESIRVDAGFHTDIGGGLILTDRSRLKLQGDAPVTLIVAGDLVDDPSASGNRTTALDMDVSVEVAVPFGLDNAELIAHRARADLVQVFKTSLRDRTEGFRKFVVTGSSFSSDADEQGITFTLVQVTARAGLTETVSPAA